MIDCIVVGGGIAGVYCALKTPNSLILEASDSWGGRVHTHQNPHYECGAGRYHEKHVILKKLIRLFGLTPIKINHGEFRGDDGKVMLDPSEFLKKKLPIDSAKGNIQPLFCLCTKTCTGTRPSST